MNKETGATFRQKDLFILLKKPYETKSLQTSNTKIYPST